MKNSIDVLCSSCNQRFQAPVSYQGNTVLCVHCKASVLAVEAPSLEPRQIVNAVSKTTPKSNQEEVSLWDKLNSFKFKELTKKEIIICVAGVCLLIGSIVSTMKDKESKKQVAEFDKHVDEHNEFIKSSRTGSNETRSPDVIDVKRFLEENAKDANSIKILNYSPFESVETGGYRAMVKYSGTNSFGATVTSTKVFYVKWGDSRYEVYHVLDYK